MQKQCFKCGENKPLKDFYKHKQMADGHLNKCKACTRKDVTSNRYRNHAYYLAYDNKRYHDKPDRRQSAFLSMQKQRKANPQKTRARDAVAKAMRDGRLTRKPCEVCGCDQSEAHHEDYAKPLNVVWLCRTHHMQRHRTSIHAPSA